MKEKDLGYEPSHFDDMPILGAKWFAPKVSGSQVTFCEVELRFPLLKTILVFHLRRQLVLWAVGVW